MPVIENFDFLLKFSNVFAPLGLSRGLRSRKVKQIPYIPLLEEFYQTNKRPSFSDIQVSDFFPLI